ncbi:MAG: response regulator transcription factor [Actinomycetes bacterium]
MRLLLVEDDDDVATLVTFVLEATGHELVRESDGQAAIDGLDAARFDAALVDVMLPGADGFAVVRNIRASERHHEVPVVQLTAAASEDDHIRGYEAGADAYLVKPFDPKAVTDLLDRLVERGAAGRKADRVEQLRQSRFLRGIEHRF